MSALNQSMKTAKNQLMRNLIRSLYVRIRRPSRKGVIHGASSILISLSLTSPLYAGDYIDRPEVKSLKKELIEEHAFKEAELKEIFASAKRKQSIIDAMTRPAEKTKTWGEYRDIFIFPKSINKGVKFWNSHRTALEDSSKKFGVPPEIIVAIIGVETRYGQYKGSYRVIDALSTLAFDYPPRSPFFLKELKQFILLSRESGLSALDTKGSYAGAMGYPQFIPSSYRNYAIDFDDSGNVDLVNSKKDAIGSVGNYFNIHGWVTDEQVLLEAKPKVDENGQKQAELDLSDIANNSLSPNVTLNEIESRGLNIIQPDGEFPENEKGVLMELKGKNGVEHWVGLHNFYVITRYNHSRLYAMAVYQLSQEIKAKM